MATKIGTGLLKRWIYVLVLLKNDYKLVYLGENMELIARDTNYPAEFLPFLTSLLERMLQEKWAPGSYFPGGWFQHLQRSASHPVKIEAHPGTLGGFYQEELSVLKDGSWVLGEKQITGKVLAFFLRHLEFDPEPQRYRIRYPLGDRFEVRYLHHYSPPFRVKRILPAKTGCELLLNSGLKQPLEPATLRMDRRENLYCAVGAHQIPAWFEEPARWEILKNAELENGSWILPIFGQRWKLDLEAPWTFAGELPES